MSRYVGDIKGRSSYLGDAFLAHNTKIKIQTSVDFQRRACPLTGGEKLSSREDKLAKCSMINFDNSPHPP